LVYEGKGRERVRELLGNQTSKASARRTLAFLDEVLQLLPQKKLPFEQYAEQARALITARQSGLTTRLDDNRQRNELKTRVLLGIIHHLGSDFEAKEIARGFVYRGTHRDALEKALVERFETDQAAMVMNALERIQQDVALLDRRQLHNQDVDAFSFHFDARTLSSNFLPEGFIAHGLANLERTTVSEVLKDATSTGARPNILSVFVKKGADELSGQKSELYVAFEEPVGHKVVGVAQLSNGKITALKTFNPARKKRGQR
ncbi:MAG: hypothetical protein AB7V46_23080, partial [Thermomicrobiales bacterium]